MKECKNKLVERQDQISSFGYQSKQRIMIDE